MGDRAGNGIHFGVCDCGYRTASIAQGALDDDSSSSLASGGFSRVGFDAVDLADRITAGHGPDGHGAG
jgi:hypothetical protein